MSNRLPRTIPASCSTRSTLPSLQWSSLTLSSRARPRTSRRLKPGAALPSSRAWNGPRTSRTSTARGDSKPPTLSAPTFASLRAGLFSDPGPPVPVRASRVRDVPFPVRSSNSTRTSISSAAKEQHLISLCARIVLYNTKCVCVHVRVFRVYRARGGFLDPFSWSGMVVVV